MLNHSMSTKKDPGRDFPIKAAIYNATLTTESFTKGTSPNLQDSVSQKTYACPICEESMISLAQLNRHIDDIHDSDPSTENSGALGPESAKKVAKTSGGTPHKRSLKLDLHENNSRFSLSENGDSGESPEAAKLSRAHWKHLSQQKMSVCADSSCKSVLNVRNGMINCRKCGDLFCNEHMKSKARLSNGPRNEKDRHVLPVYDSVHGKMARVCTQCYNKKPSIQLGTQVNTVDLTSTFVKSRQGHIENRQLAQSSMHTRLLKLVDLHAQSYLWHKTNGASLFSFFVKENPFPKERILNLEKEIVGIENWQADEDASHCKICLTKFGILVRKHHCRLCGSVVNDGTFTGADPSDFCSAQVPMGLLLKKLPSLNYSPIVKANWESLVSAGTEASSSSTSSSSSVANAHFYIRVCKPCKNLLLYKATGDTLTDSRDVADVLDAYDQILAIKATIVHFMARYHTLVADNKESHNQQTNRVRVRLRKAVKDLEIMVNSFLNRFFAVDPASRKLAPVHSAKLVTNIYKASAAYLQESILELKRLNEAFSLAENQKLAGQLGAANTFTNTTTGTPVSSSSLSTTISPQQPTTPRLTKKQIRELREQLMVTNEQRFIIESLIEDVKRQRKFDELITLEENKKELTSKIDELTEELGEFAF